MGDPWEIYGRPVGDLREAHGRLIGYNGVPLECHRSTMIPWTSHASLFGDPWTLHESPGGGPCEVDRSTTNTWEPCGKIHGIPKKEGTVNPLETHGLPMGYPWENHEAHRSPMVKPMRPMGD